MLVMHQVTACLVHGHDPNAHVFLSTQFAGDTNTNIECLKRVLENVSVTLASQEKPMPMNLAIQMDNTQKDNKNTKSALFPFCRGSQGSADYVCAQDVFLSCRSFMSEAGVRENSAQFSPRRFLRCAQYFALLLMMLRSGCPSVTKHVCARAHA
jgi:hypothetical protein